MCIPSSFGAYPTFGKQLGLVYLPSDIVANLLQVRRVWTDVQVEVIHYQFSSSSSFSDSNFLLFTFTPTKLAVCTTEASYIYFLIVNERNINGKQS